MPASGRVIRYVPHPVITGFTTGIAVIIASSQVNDFLGLAIERLPADFLPRWSAYLGVLDRIDPTTTALATGSLALILMLRRWAPRLPAFLIAIAAGAVLVWLLALPVDTIGSRFPHMAGGLPMPALPAFSLAKIEALAPAAFTIAFLAGIESLLSAVVADGMTGFRHRSNQELVGQGAGFVDTQLLYLTKRADFHRRMARRAACGEARNARPAFVAAYLCRIEYCTRRSEAERNAGADAPCPITPIAATPELAA